MNIKNQNQKQMWKWGRSWYFLERSKYYAELNNYSYAAHKSDLFTSYSRNYISFISQSMDIGGGFTESVNFNDPLVLRNNYSLNALSFRRL